MLNPFHLFHLAPMPNVSSISYASSLPVRLDRYCPQSTKECLKYQELLNIFCIVYFCVIYTVEFVMEACSVVIAIDTSLSMTDSQRNSEINKRKLG